MTALTNKRVLVFGGTGSLGRALIRRLVDDNRLMIYSRDEAKHWTLRQEFRGAVNLSLMVGDVRDPDRVERAVLTFRPNVIIIAAALKHVDTCENSPFESIQTNVIGVKNVVDAVERNQAVLGELETVLVVSTDKACAPVNVYGMCKAIAERLVTSRSKELGSPNFVGVRYGNVLDSRGSIIPLFRYQALTAPSFTLTHPEMTRFVMTLDESVDLITGTITGARSGEIWVPKLPSMSIRDLAEIFSERYGKPVEIVGMRPGEKLHEALITSAESLHVEERERHYVLGPAHAEPALDPRMFDYTSADDVMSKEALLARLTELQMFDARLADQSEEYRVKAGMP